MMERRKLPLEPLLVPTGVALWTEEHGPLIVIDAVNLVTQLREVRTHLRTDQARGTGNQQQAPLWQHLAKYYTVSALTQTRTPIDAGSAFRAEDQARFNVFVDWVRRSAEEDAPWLCEF